MIPAAFEYHRPASVSEALQLLQQLSDAKLLAGGHSLLPMMKLRLTSPAHLIDLGRIEAMRYIRQDGQTLAIGALTTHWGIESSQVAHTTAPALAEAASRIGDVQVRNVGTIGGSLAHADPAADYPAAMLALDGQIVAESPRGRRTIPAVEFFTGIFTTALAPEEVLVEIRVPAPSGRAGQAYLKFPHPASRFAVVGVAAAVTLDGQGNASKVGVGVTGAGTKAVRAKTVEAACAGKKLDAAAIEAAAQKGHEGVDV